MSSPTSDIAVPSPNMGNIRARIVIAALIALAIGVIYVSNLLLTQRFLDSQRNRSQLRVALYSGNLMSELQRNSVVPLLLSRDPALISALSSKDFSNSTARLISYRDEIESASIMLLDLDGRVVASTIRETIGAPRHGEPLFTKSMRSDDTVFAISPQNSGITDFSYARKIEAGGEVLGAIVVSVDLRKFEHSWAGISDAVLVTDSEGLIILSTEPRWRSKTEPDALTTMSAADAIQKNLRNLVDWNGLPTEILFSGDAVIRNETRVGFQGWRIISYTSQASVREKVNTFLSLEIMGFALLFSGVFYLMSRRAQGRSLLFQRESTELRALNNALQREVAERKRAEENLQVAEQTLQQSSKLAVLGEMSAAVSHELNQPLAAMKTYLAGAKLLLNRKRPDEAIASFQRVDDLIERMGAITRQLKSYARKGSDSFEPIDLRDCIAVALSMMEPQLNHRDVHISKNLTRDAVMVMGDRLRIEQVLINLLRNALDATKSQSDPQVDILLSHAEVATITVRDNGGGIDDLDSLFEPFYTTKSAGDGVGLGLAISSGIVADLGGRLFARNAQAGGAVFVVELPILRELDLQNT